MISTFVLFGATGDLAGRFLLPAFAALHAAGALPEDFSITGAALEDWDDVTFRRHSRQWLDQQAGKLPDSAVEALLRSLRYQQVDLRDPSSVAHMTGVTGSNLFDRPVAVYLALPPGVFPIASNALSKAGLAPDSRIVVEKPFGEDLASAKALNAQLARFAGGAGEAAIFRVDHVLGMATVQNLIGLRFANRILEPIWNSKHIEEIEVLWEETLALEGRAGYFDSAGALKDVVQNHMLQLLTLIAMEPPDSLGEPDLRDRKVEALQAVQTLNFEQVSARSQRARYTAGRLASRGGASGQDVPDYASEEGVDPERGTETFAEVLLALDNPRWTGTRFRLRAGKALSERRKAVIVHFRPVAHAPYGRTEATANVPAANTLRIGIDGPSDIVLNLNGTSASTPVILTAPPPDSELPPYANVLMDILNGGSTLAVRGDEAEEAWRIVAPVMDGWDAGLVPLGEYPAGSAGPPRIGHHEDSA